MMHCLLSLYLSIGITAFCLSPDECTEPVHVVSSESADTIANEGHYMSICLEDTMYTFETSCIKEVTYDDNEYIRNNVCAYNKLSLYVKLDANTPTRQSVIIINDTVLAFNAIGAGVATSMTSGESVYFEPECITYHPHCNVVNCISYSGKHYVYLSEWDGKHRCFVEELRYDSYTHKWISKLKQILSLEIADSIRGSGNMDWIVDQKNNMIYVQSYKDGSSKNSTGLIFLQFTLPTLSDDKKEVVLKANQIIRRIEYPMIYVTQDKFIYKDKLYIASGEEENLPGKITVIDVTEFVEQETYELDFTDDEPEGIEMYKDNIFVFYSTQQYNIQNKESTFIKFLNGVCLSYPNSQIMKITFY